MMLLGCLCCADTENEAIAKAPNVVILLVDTLRADHTSLYGYQRNTTPHLDSMAEAGLVARNHFSNAPWTKPSVASILTGLHPSAHGSRKGQFKDLQKYDELVKAGKPPMIEVLAEQVTTMAERLKDAGYRTATYYSNPHLSEKFGYAQGYDEFEFESDKQAIDRTIAFLERSKQPAFVWCHLMGVHEYRFPARFDLFESSTATPIDPQALQVRRVKKYESLENAVDAYDNSILYADSLLGKLFEFIQDRESNTILVVTSDHGEEFYEHGGFEHVNTLYHEILNIPLVIWGPGVPVGEIEGLTDSTDILPTILRAIGAEVPAELTGQTLYSENVPAMGKPQVFAEQHNRGPKSRFAMIRRDGKLIVSISKKSGAESFELFAEGLSIEGEKIEEPSEQAIFEDLRSEIEAHRRANEIYFRDNVGSSEYTHLTAEEVENLEALGYVDP